MNIVITSFGGGFTNCGKHLIDRLLRYSDDVIDLILVYNIGDLDTSLECFNHPKVWIANFPEETKTFFNGYFFPKQFAWISSAMWDARRYEGNILWMDAGQIPIMSLDNVFKIIEEEGIFTGTLHHNMVEYRNDGTRCTSEPCINYFNLTEEQKKKPMLSTAIFGYSTKSRYLDCIKQHYEACQIKDIIYGNRSIHNSDQSVLSCIISKTDYVPLDIIVDSDFGVQRRTYLGRDKENVLEVIRIKDHKDFIDRIMRRYK